MSLCDNRKIFNRWRRILIPTGFCCFALRCLCSLTTFMFIVSVRFEKIKNFFDEKNNFESDFFHTWILKNSTNWDLWPHFYDEKLRREPSSAYCFFSDLKNTFVYPNEVGTQFFQRQGPQEHTFCPGIWRWLIWFAYTHYIFYRFA